jgi:inosose dehydratase
MTLPVTITCAPCCWGVDDVSNPHLPRWERVLDEAAEAGFGGLELGPYGYMPLDVARVGAALEARGLRIVAGTIFDDLVSPQNLESLLCQTNEICALIAALPRPDTHAGQRFPAPYLTVMDWGHDERDYTAGHPDRAPRLDSEVWDGMVGNIRAIAELARDHYGVRAVIHPHAGGYMALRHTHRLYPLQGHRQREVRRCHGAPHPVLRRLRRRRHVPDRSRPD